MKSNNDKYLHHFILFSPMNRFKVLIWRIFTKKHIQNQRLILVFFFMIESLLNVLDVQQVYFYFVFFFSVDFYKF